LKVSVSVDGEGGFAWDEVRKLPESKLQAAGDAEDGRARWPRPDLQLRGWIRVRRIGGSRQARRVRLLACLEAARPDGRVQPESASWKRVPVLPWQGPGGRGGPADPQGCVAGRGYAPVGHGHPEVAARPLRWKLVLRCRGRQQLHHHGLLPRRAGDDRVSSEASHRRGLHESSVHDPR